MCGEKVLLYDSEYQQHGQDRASHKRQVLCQYGDDGVGEQVHVLDRGSVGTIQSTGEKNVCVKWTLQNEDHFINRVPYLLLTIEGHTVYTSYHAPCIYFFHTSAL